MREGEVAVFWLIILTVLAITIVVYLVDRSRNERKDAPADEHKS